MEDIRKSLKQSSGSGIDIMDWLHPASETWAQWEKELGLHPLTIKDAKVKTCLQYFQGQSLMIRKELWASGTFLDDLMIFF